MAFIDGEETFSFDSFDVILSESNTAKVDLRMLQAAPLSSSVGVGLLMGDYCYWMGSWVLVAGLELRPPTCRGGTERGRPVVRWKDRMKELVIEEERLNLQGRSVARERWRLFCRGHPFEGPSWRE